MKLKVGFDAPYPIHELSFALVQGRLFVSVTSDQSLGGTSSRLLSDFELDVLSDFVNEAKAARERRMG